MARTNKLGTHCTTVSKSEEVTRVTYHQTVVVAFNDKEIVLDSGGWRSATTKQRINQASNQFGLNLSVYQSKGDWYVDYQGVTLDFRDGLVLSR